MNSWSEPSDEIQQWADALDARRRSDTQWVARCPNPEHLDSDASFGFAEGRKKPVVAGCYGCDDWAGIEAGLAELGLDLKNMSRRKRSGPKTRTVTPRELRAGALPPPALPDQKKPTRDQNRLLADTPKARYFLEFLENARGLSTETISKFQIGMDGERITIPVADSGGVWRNVRRYLPEVTQKKILNLDGHGSPGMLYPLETLATPDVPVLLCEGEWDALLANQESEGLFVALTGTGGATTPPAGLAALADRDVFVAYDADDAGVAGAEKVQARLLDAGARAHILDLTRLGLPFAASHGKDISDFFLFADGSAGAIVAEMERLRSRTRSRFRAVSAAELAQPVPALQWLVQGAVADNTYGPIAGEKKTLKTQTNLSLALSVASGRPFLGHFAVPKPQPVLFYLGEGGQTPTTRRLQRLARHMDIDLASLENFRMVFDAASLTGDEFLRSFEQHVAEESPGLVIIDPLYAFHPPDIEAQNLYARGAMLAEVQQMIPDGATLLIADHFRKTQVGTALDLDSIAQSGMAAWADSWVIQRHDTPPVVDKGEFSIRMQFGSRQWGGGEYLAKWHLGTFDPEEGDHTGELSVEVQPVSWGTRIEKTHTADLIEATILGVLEREPLVHTKNKCFELVREQCGVGEAKVRAAWERFESDGVIESQKAPGQGGKYLRWRRAQQARQVISLSESSTPQSDSEVTPASAPQVTSVRR